MVGVAVSSSLGPGHVVVVPRGELDVTGATRFARAPSGRLINWLIAAARSVAVQLQLLLRPGRSFEPFGPVGPSVQSTTTTI